MATVRLPRLLEGAARGKLRHDVPVGTLGEALDGLFSSEPALRPHLLDEAGAIRPHVLIFVDGKRSDLKTTVTADSEVIVLQAVSGGDVVPAGLVGRVKTNQIA